MGNCLKTQLKENIQNNNLNYLGAISLSVHPNGSAEPSDDERSLLLKGDSPFTIIATDGGSFEISTDRGTFINEYTVNNSDLSIQIFVASGDYKLILKDFKYQCVIVQNNIWGGSMIGLIHFDNIEDFCYSDYYSIVTNDNRSNVGGTELSPKVDAPRAYKFSVRGNKNIKADLSAIAQHWSSLREFTIESMTCIGALTDLSTLINANAIRLTGCEINGTLENLLDGLHSNGKVSGRLETGFYGTGVIYNGETITETLYFTFDANGWQEES